MNNTEPLTYNPYRFDTYDDPYETYRRLRDEEPIYHNEELDFFVLSRFSDVLEGFRDHQTFSSAGGIALENRRPVNSDEGPMRSMIELDPPEHTAFRKLVARVFTGRRVAEMESQTRHIVNHYIDQIIEKGEADLVADISGPFPMDVISAILGIPESDRAELRVYADAILIREDGSMQLPAAALDGMFSLLNYFVEDLPKRREHNLEGLITDLLDLEVDGRALTEEELLGFCVLFVIAGHETTTKMVANAVEILDRHPDQREVFVDNLDRAPDVVEEVLRYHNSTQYMHRTVMTPIERHGQALAPGDSVLLHIGAANHDDREFGPTAGQFDFTRRPERHLAFGYGAHFCLGASLARMEGKVALTEIHRRLGDYEVDSDNKVRFHSGNVTGWEKLPISFTPRK